MVARAPKSFLAAAIRAAAMSGCGSVGAATTMVSSLTGGSKAGGVSRRGRGEVVTGGSEAGSWAGVVVRAPKSLFAAAIRAATMSTGGGVATTMSPSSGGGSPKAGGVAGRGRGEVVAGGSEAGGKTGGGAKTSGMSSRER